MHYAELVALWKAKGAEGLTTLLFPCNQFGGQEPGSPQEIKSFAKQFGVSCEGNFLLMEKVDVNGDNTHPVYRYLKGATADSSDIKWNFGSYWLIDRNGGVERLAGGRNSPKNFAAQVDAALSK